MPSNCHVGVVGHKPDKVVMVLNITFGDIKHFLSVTYEK